MIRQYASYFVSFLLSNLDNKSLENIGNIILYGSVARGDAEKDSDIDIFIEINKKNKKIEKQIKKILDKFYGSREATLFKLKGIENEISLKIGKLKDWEELYGSIISDGIVLYGHYNATELPSGIKHYIIIYWDRIDKNRGAFLNRIYGFSVKGRKYEGILDRYSGRRLGKSCVMLPVSHKNEIFGLLRAYKVRAKVLEVFVG